jgi:hypothetical protein
MRPENVHSDNTKLLERVEDAGILNSVSLPPVASESSPELATRANQRAKQHTQQNKFVIVAAGAVVTALLIFVAVSMPHRRSPQKTKSQAATIGESTAETSSEDKSLFPITDSGRPAAKETHQGFLNEHDLERTVIRSSAKTSQSTPTSELGTLGSIPPFGDKWQTPPYQADSTVPDSSDLGKVQRSEMEKPSLVYVRKVSTSPSASQTTNDGVSELGLGLATGTRLRARLESAASTAIRAPVLAVIEYNYEQCGEIIVPAGAKAVGHIREANRTGYMDLEFDSLLMPDGSSIPIQAAATGLDLRPLKGKVEGKNTGKNILVRSLSGIGQAGSLFLGQGSLNQPLSESDLMRERLASNVGENGDEEVSRLSVNQRVVVTVSAGIPIYVLFQQSPKSGQPPAASSVRSVHASVAAKMDQLRQFLQWQQELDQSAATNPSAQ